MCLIHHHHQQQHQQHPQHPRQPQQHPPQHQLSKHLPFPAPTARNQPQSPAPPPTIGIESPHPVGGRDKLADISMLEEGSNDESDTEHTHHRRRAGAGAGAGVPCINIGASPVRNGNGGPPGIRVDSAPIPIVPMINVDSVAKQRMGSRSVPAPAINVDAPGPPLARINIENAIRAWGSGRSIRSVLLCGVWRSVGVAFDRVPRLQRRGGSERRRRIRRVHGVQRPPLLRSVPRPSAAAQVQALQAVDTGQRRGCGGAGWQVVLGVLRVRCELCFLRFHGNRTSAHVR
ncbi:hypothetical protein B0H34DRAFT_503881 [Crassisporium funariophilum]|nr:hypothetical protein B0H34DRAFT_503881 [Crassisporium funariophilum]